MMMKTDRGFAPAAYHRVLGGREIQQFNDVTRTMGLNLYGWLERKDVDCWSAVSYHEIPRNYALYAALFSVRDSWRVRPLPFMREAPEDLSPEVAREFFDDGEPWGEIYSLSSASILSVEWSNRVSWPRDRIEIYFIDPDNGLHLRGRDCPFPSLLDETEVAELLKHRELRKKQWCYKAAEQRIPISVASEWLKVVHEVSLLARQGTESRFVACVA